ncbi:MAG TPA: PAS domain-containing protein [Candidatus Kapabacteria bacterium]|nr:PAS domain-containing protein [Candidatus Kapabacteria bacterium]
MPERIHGIAIDILNYLPEMAFFVSGDGKVLEANTSAEKILGMKKDEIIGVSFSTFLQVAFHEHFRYSFKQAITTGKPHEYEAEMKIGKEKKDVLLHISRYPAEAEAEHALGFVFAYTLSRDTKKDMDLLRFANVAHYTVNPLEITDPQGKIIYVNPAFEKASGYSKEEVIGQNPNIFSSGKQSKGFWEKVWKKISTGDVWEGEIENRKQTGEPFFTHLLISPIVNDQGSIVGYFGIHRDITEKRYLEQKLVQAQKMESIGLLAAGIAHEVGNPLTSISSLVQVIQRTTTDVSAKDKLELIKSQVSRISRIIRDLVDFSRKSSYTVIPTDINKTVNEAVEIVRVGKKAKSLSFRVNLESHMPTIPLVPDQIEQVFINILINAVDAIFSMEPSSAEPKQKQIDVVSGLKGENVVVTISDTGKGIEEEDIPKVFEPFFTTKQVGEGTGLGLWVSYGIIKSFHGDIFVESQKGKGTTFSVILPINQELL